MKIAVVTGASSGIGKAIAARLLEDGMKVYGVSQSGHVPVGCEDFRADLACWSTLQPLLNAIKQHRALDVLVHAAGIFYTGTDPDMIETQYCVNTKAPSYISTALISSLESAKGQVVFLNSIAGLRSALHTVHHTKLEAYATSKNELRKFADCFRTEVNPKGIRVVSVHLGKVATRMQELCCREEGQPYRPEILLQPEDVAATIVQCLNLPRHAEVTDITLRSMHV